MSKSVNNHFVEIILCDLLCVVSFVGLDVEMSSFFFFFAFFKSDIKVLQRGVCLALSRSEQFSGCFSSSPLPSPTQKKIKA